MDAVCAETVSPTRFCFDADGELETKLSYDRNHAVARTLLKPFVWMHSKQTHACKPFFSPMRDAPVY